MRFRILDGRASSDLSRWEALWRAWPAPDVMAHPRYALLFARPEDRVVCAVGDGEEGAILFPLLLRPLAAEPWARPGEARLDATSPYGYGGPFAWGRSRLDSAFWGAFAAWARDERVVTTFARLSLFADQLAPLPSPPQERAPNVVIPLGDGPGALWRGYEPRVRRCVRRAVRSGLTVQIDLSGARLDAFLSVYAHTMERNHADPWYFFPRAFFEELVSGLAGHFAFVHALQGGEVVGSDLLLCAADHAYYFLGGTHTDALALGASYLMKHQAALWAMETGRRNVVLGGGYAPGDGLFHFKLGFAPTGVVPFRTAALVHDEAACAALAADRARHAAGTGRPWTPRPGWFPSYRA